MPRPKLPKPTRLRIASALFVALTATALAASCANDTRDSHCEPGGGGDCISNPDGKGPQIAEPRCALPVEGDAFLLDHEVGFGEVLEFMQDAKKGNCIASGCHGSEATAAVAISFPQSSPGTLDPCLTYKKLKATAGSVGLAYVVENVVPVDGSEDTVNEALQSWMYCSVTGTPGGGFPMPKPGGVPVPQQADVIHDWILSGAHGPDGCVETDGS